MSKQSGIIWSFALIAALVMAGAIAGCTSTENPAQAAPGVPATLTQTTALPVTAPPLAVLPAATATVAASPSATSTASISSTSVVIKNLEFSPSAITVETGTTVTWTNLDSVPHDVTSTASSPVAFKSATLQQGASYQFTFTQAGTYQYSCSIHPFMKGKVKVEG